MGTPTWILPQGSDLTQALMYVGTPIQECIMLRTKPCLTFLTCIFALAVGPAFAGQHHSKIAPDAVQTQSSSTVPVIIQYLQEPGSQQDKGVSNFGGRVKSRLHSIHAIAADIPQSALDQLANDPNVS